MERKDEGKEENQRGQGQTRTEHEWNDVNNGDDRDRPQMADDNDSQALTGGDNTRCRALVARVSYLSQDRPDLKFDSMQVCCAMAKPTLRDMERVKRIGRYLAGKPRARCWFRWQQSGELEAYSDADWGGDRATRRSVSAGVIMSGGHCLRAWTKKQQVVSLSSADSELYAAVKTASEGLGIQIVAKDLGISCGLNLHLDSSATMCLVKRRGLGKARRYAESVDTGGFQIRPVRHEESRHERETSRLDDKTAGKAEDRAAHEHHGLRIHESWSLTCVRDRGC